LTWAKNQARRQKAQAPISLARTKERSFAMFAFMTFAT
jgi:hypothetical protein